MSKLYTLVTHKPGNMPEVKLPHRPFSDCYTVGKNFLDSVILNQFGTLRTPLVSTTENIVTSRNVNGREFKTTHGEAVLLGKVVLATYDVVED